MRKTTLIAALIASSTVGLISLTLLTAQAPTSAPAAGPTRIVDLMTSEGAAELNAQWRYSDVRIVEAPPVTPGDNAGFAYDIQPHAGEANFDDSAWPVIEPKTLGDRRAGGKVSFGWYRITLTMPSRLGSVDTSGAKAFFSVTIDDYAEVWVNGQLPRGVGKPSPNAIVGFNTPNRVLLAEAVKPGDKIQIAIFGINGPISIAPANRLFMREAKVEFVQGGGQNQPAEPALKEVTAPDIPGVIKGGTKVVLLRDGLNGTEGVISMPDGSMLFTEQDANKILKVDKNDNISTYLENTNRTIGLAYDRKGRLIGTQSREPMVGVLAPTRQALADKFEGQPLVRPNDLVIDRNNGIYFTDPIPNPQQAFREPPSGRKPLLFYLRPDGQLMKLTEEVTAPNGVQLSPDEKTLYATNGNRIMAFDVQPDGSVKNGRTFVMSGGDGLAIDSAGRLYAAVGGVRGVRVFSPQGQDLGTIPSGTPPQSVGFAGPEKKTLYIVGRGALYKTQMLAEGIRSRAK